MIRRISLLFVAVLFTLLSCKSSSSVIRDMGAAQGTQHTTQSGSDGIISKQQEEEAKQAAADARKAAKEDAKRRRNERTDKSLGIVFTPVRKYDVKNGNVRIVLHRKSGSFNIYAINKRGRSIPILSNVDDSVSSYFSVLVGRREYRLNKAASVSCQVRQLGDSGQLAYVLPGTFEVVVDFSAVASTIGGTNDIVKVTVYTTNLAQNRQVLAVKGVFDTVLGENYPYHFITATGQKISGEKLFTSFKDERYFITTNQKTSAQFLFDGKTILSPEVVSFANKNDIADGLWRPVIKETRSFNSVLAYNNSAMCANWPYFSVEPGETNTFTFYIAVSTDEEQPKGLAFVDTLVDDSQKTQGVDGSNAEIIVKKPDDNTILAAITDDKLDPEYIQNLIDRINSLNSDPKLVDRTELRQLNAELDAILERIRQLRQR